MRLINIATLELEEFVGDGIPPYCILSHRWIGKETTYKDFRKGYLKDSPGYQKIVRFCSVVKHDMLQYSFFWPYPYSKDRFQYVWVDTCKTLELCAWTTTNSTKAASTRSLVRS